MLVAGIFTQVASAVCQLGVFSGAEACCFIFWRALLRGPHPTLYVFYYERPPPLPSQEVHRVLDSSGLC